MSQSEIDAMLADRLSQTPKIISEDIMWQKTGRGYRLRVRVFAPELDEALDLIGVMGKTNYSFTLMYQNVPIRRYDAQGRHTSMQGCLAELKPGVTIHGPHKHIWTKDQQDNCAYVPGDIDPDADLNTRFIQFMAEQNISFIGNYQPIALEAGT